MRNEYENSKEYYLYQYYMKWNQCLMEARKNAELDNPDAITLEATEIFEETAGYEAIAGYYISLHGDSAYKDWCTNTEHLRPDKLSEQDLKVEEVLKILYAA